MPRRPSRSGRKPVGAAGSGAGDGCCASRIRVGGAGLAAARGGLFAGVAAAFGTTGLAATGLAVAVLGFRRATGLTAAFGITGFVAAGFGAAALGVGLAAGFGAAAFGVVRAGRLDGAVGATGFAAAGFAGTGFAAAGFAAAGFADALARGVGVFETARGFEALADAAFGLAFTVSSLGPSLGSACSALGRRGKGTGFELLLDQTRRTASPARTVPPRTTRAFKPRIRRSRPTGELIQRSASLPKRALNLAHPVWGCSLTSSSAEPIARRLPGGSASMLRLKST